MIGLPEYRREVLLTLHELGGAGNRLVVLDRIRERLGRRLNAPHWIRVGMQTGRPRWHDGVDYARLQLRARGLVSANTPRGHWELTVYGRAEAKRLLEEGSDHDDQEQAEGQTARDHPSDS